MSDRDLLELKIKIAEETRRRAAASKADRPSGFEALISNAAQGVSFGTADEMKAWLRSKVLGSSYDDELSSARGRLEQTREDYPVTSFVAEAGGAVLPSILTGGSIPALALGSTAYGFGTGEGGFGNRAVNAGISGALGTAGGVVANKVGDAVATALARRSAIKAAPTGEALLGDAQGLYNAATARGAKAGEAQTTDIALRLMDIADKVTGPTGKVEPAYNKIASAMAIMERYAGHPVTPEQMKDILRPALQNAAKAGGHEGKLGTQMLRTFDDWSKTIAPELRMADAIYSRFKAGKTIDKTVDLAAEGGGTAASRLKSGFDSLRKADIKGKEHFTPALMKEVERMAGGGSKPQKVAQGIGSLSPPSWRAGISPLGIGAMGLFTGNPVAGAAVAGGTSGAGMLANMLANRLAKGGAKAAGAVARSGQPLPEGMTPETLQALIQALSMTSGARAAP